MQTKRDIIMLAEGRRILALLQAGKVAEAVRLAASRGG